MEQRIQNIREAASYDHEKMSAPKEFWPSRMDKELEQWFEERRKAYRRSLDERPLDDEY